MKNFHTLSYTMKQTIFILEKEQSEESISSPFLATLFGLPCVAKSCWYRGENWNFNTMLRKYLKYYHITFRIQIWTR